MDRQSQFLIGVRRGGAGGDVDVSVNADFEAHAWVEAAGRTYSSIGIEGLDVMLALPERNGHVSGV
ncbi:MAG: hypothetical protein AB7G93_21875 [Bdellovibrionales bacterium]